MLDFSNYIQRCQEGVDPKNQKLEVTWYKDLSGKKIFTCSCECGSNKMLVVPNGVRCTECALFHSHDSWTRAAELARQAAANQDGEIQAIDQPFLVKKRIRIISPWEQEKLTKQEAGISETATPFLVRLRKRIKLYANADRPV